MGRQCAICEEVIAGPGRQVGDRYLCPSPECRALLDQQAHLPPIAFELHRERFRRQRGERNERLAARRRQVETVRVRELDEDRSLLARALAARPETDPEAARVVAIPTSPSAAAAPDPERLAAYRRHLATIVAEATEHPDAASLEDERDRSHVDDLLEQDRQFAARPVLAATCDALCGRCRGGCCQRGGDDAYLTALDARRWLDAHPDQGPEDLLALYHSLLPPAAITGSCINQTPTGCALPRELRSTICNRYFCESIEDLIAETTTDTAPLLVVRRDHHAWNRFDPGDNSVVEVLWLESGRVTVADLVPEDDDPAEAASASADPGGTGPPPVES